MLKLPTRPDEAFSPRLAPPAQDKTLPLPSTPDDNDALLQYKVVFPICDAFQENKSPVHGWTGLTKHEVL